jgi:cadmium resistance protein CadD (predicted permease)
VATVWLELDQLGVSVPQFCCVIVAATVVVCAIGTVTVPGLIVTADTMQVAGGVGLLPVSEPQAAATTREHRATRARVFTGGS